MKRLLIYGCLVLALAMAVQAQTVNPDEQAVLAAYERWGFPAFVLKVRTPGTDYWTHEVGFITMFGSRLVVGRGGSWKAAFVDADRARAQRPAPPIGPE